MRRKRTSSQLYDFINSFATPQEYLIGLYEAKYIEKLPFVQHIAVDQIAYFEATGQADKVRKLIDQGNRQAAERVNPKKAAVKDPPQRQYKDDDDPGF